jgi:hypothetical protein
MNDRHRRRQLCFGEELGLRIQLRVERAMEAQEGRSGYRRRFNQGRVPPGYANQFTEGRSERRLRGQTLPCRRSLFGQRRMRTFRELRLSTMITAMVFVAFPMLMRAVGRIVIIIMGGTTPM